ncbi:hypothetical protein PVL30_004010 [Lodderomyces elongisporus]|uniref:uncharacterized protein n=1 Tax=Lodderomyces elongisporus TaxID=36914 RepID=UPI00292054D2|nr:uncharacterized protein PVL30_004010 [Lodderomyces elongisporus]WLF80234.1 hypothetical protein PVL30_004010 [Lodderomyces elongisporus]
MNTSMNTSTTLTTPNSNRQFEQSYKLALKHFINRNFSQAFQQSRTLFIQAFDEYRTGSISMNLLVKVIDLYLVVVGVSLREKRLNQIMTTEAKNSITSNEVWNLISSVWGSKHGEDVPWEILYNWHLLMISNLELIQDRSEYLRDLKRVYTRLSIDEIDGEGQSEKYVNKLMILIKFEILPRLDQYEESYRLIGDNVEEREKLDKIKQNRIDAEQKAQETKKQEEKKLKEEKEKQDAEARKLARESNLKYRSIKEIRRGYEDNGDEKRLSIKENQDIDGRVDTIKSRLIYLSKLMKSYLSQNYMVLIVLVIAALGSGKYLRQANIREKVIETVKMAFKFTYV